MTLQVHAQAGKTTLPFIIHSNLPQNEKVIRFLAEWSLGEAQMAEDPLGQPHFERCRQLTSMSSVKVLPKCALIFELGTGNELHLREIAEKYDVIWIVNLDMSTIFLGLSKVPPKLLSKFRIVQADFTGFYTAFAEKVEALTNLPEADFWKGVNEMLPTLRYTPFSFPYKSFSLVVANQASFKIAMLFFNTCVKGKSVPALDERFSHFMRGVHQKFIQTLHACVSPDGVIQLQTIHTIGDKPCIHMETLTRAIDRFFMVNNREEWARQHSRFSSNVIAYELFPRPVDTHTFVPIVQDPNHKGITSTAAHLLASENDIFYLCGTKPETQTHYQNSKEMILNVAKGLTGTALFLGIGSGNDFPLELCSQFDNIYVVDANPSVLDKFLKRIPPEYHAKFHFQLADLTGYLAEASYLAEQLVKITPKEEFVKEFKARIPKQRRPFDFPQHSASLVVSSIVSNQLVHIYEQLFISLFKKHYTTIDIPNIDLLLQSIMDFEKHHALDLKNYVHPRGAVYYSNETAVLTKGTQRDSLAFDGIPAEIISQRDGLWQFQIEVLSAKNGVAAVKQLFHIADQKLWSLDMPFDEHTTRCHQVEAYHLTV